MVRSAMAWFCCALVVCAPAWAQEAQPQVNGEQPRFQLVVLRGDDAQNNIKKGRATKAVVEVRDRNKKPVAGIAVLFLLPNSGPSGTFVGGAQTASVTTDSLGQAAVTYKPNSLPGNFNIRASVKNGDNETSINIVQTNIAAAAAGLSTTAIILLALAGAGLGIGLGVGLTRGGSSAPNPTSVTLTPGTPSAGPPK
ncbi:MAG TPA: hypothetical protein VGL53_24855 [Bryobacteraceae bacterium]